MVKHAPDAVLIVVSNPLDEMTALAAKVSGFPSHRVMGQAGMLDTARFSYFVAEKLGVPVGSVRTLTLGSHGDTMVPGPVRLHGGRQAAGRACWRPGRDRRAGRADPQRRRPRSSALLKTGSAYYAPSAAAARMARAVAEDSGAGPCRSAPGWTASTASPVCTWASRPSSGRPGMRRVVERDLTEPELAGLHEAAEAVRAKQADVASL